MAKQIKAIKCPSCGSVSKTEIKPDYFRCNSCQTEYFLDDNDININYNHNYNNPPTFPSLTGKNLKIIAIIAACLFGFFILTSIIKGIFGTTHGPTGNAYTRELTSAKDEENSFSTSRYTGILFLRADTKTPVALFLENRNYRGEKNKEKDGTYLAFYDPIKKKSITAHKMSDKRLSSADFKFRTFSDGNIYMTNDKTSFLKLDQQKLEVQDVGKTFFEANSELQIGAATLDFVYDGNGDGLILLTNDGKKRYYYPLIQKLYTEDQYYKAKEGFNNLVANAKSKTINVFTKPSSYYPEDKLQLLQITYKDNGPAPKEIPNRLSWRKDYGGSGIFTDADPYKKVLVGKWQKESGRITAWKDLTPDRLYFSPSVVLDNDQKLIIQFRADANSKSNFKLQKINRSSGAAEWTTSLNEGQEFDELISLEDGFIGIQKDKSISQIDNKGKLTSNYKVD